MLFNGMRETKQTDIVLNDIDIETFMLMLQFAYSGRVALDSNLSLQVSLLAAADKVGNSVPYPSVYN